MVAARRRASHARSRGSNVARRSVIETLSGDIRRQIDERLVAGGFSDYDGLTAWLADLGLTISRSALGRYGQELKGQYDEAMADARALLALTRAAGDLGDAGSEIAAGAATILQTDIVRTALEIRRETDADKRATLLAKLTRAQADVGRMTITVERHLAQAREEERQRLLAEQAEALKGAGKDLGVSDDTMLAIRQRLGIA